MQERKRGNYHVLRGRRGAAAGPLLYFPRENAHRCFHLGHCSWALLLGTCPKAYRPTKSRINDLWPMGKTMSEANM